MSENSFEVSQEYTTSALRFEKIKQEDAEDLFVVYNDIITRKHMNLDHRDDLNCDTLADVKSLLSSWTDHPDHMRWTVHHKLFKKAIGVVELKRLEDGTGLLNVDVQSVLEIKGVFQEIFTLAKEEFMTTFKYNQIITKEVVDNSERLLALNSSGYNPFEGNQDNYYVVK